MIDYLTGTLKVSRFWTSRFRTFTGCPKKLRKFETNKTSHDQGSVLLSKNHGDNYNKKWAPADNFSLNFLPEKGVHTWVNQLISCRNLPQGSICWKKIADPFGVLKANILVSRCWYFSRKNLCYKHQWVPLQLEIVFWSLKYQFWRIKI